MKDGEQVLASNEAEPTAPAPRASAWRSPQRIAKVGILVVAVAVAALLRLYVLESDIVEGGSMVPGLKSGDYIFISKLGRGRRPPRRFDVITFRAPSGKDVLIKRVVGLPGEWVWLWEDHVFVNGGWLREPYLHRWRGGFGAPVWVARDSIYVLGDNRDESEDSRVWGPIALSSVRGRAVLVFFPFTRARIIR